MVAKEVIGLDLKFGNTLELSNWLRSRKWQQAEKHGEPLMDRERRHFVSEVPSSMIGLASRCPRLDVIRSYEWKLDFKHLLTLTRIFLRSPSVRIAFLFIFSNL